MNNLAILIEREIVEHQNKIKSNTEYLSHIASALEKLSADKVTIAHNLSVLGGALNAYMEMLKKLKEEEVKSNGECADETA